MPSTGQQSLPTSPLAPAPPTFSLRRLLAAAGSRLEDRPGWSQSRLASEEKGEAIHAGAFVLALRM